MWTVPGTLLPLAEKNEGLVIAVLASAVRMNNNPRRIKKLPSSHCPTPKNYLYPNSKAWTEVRGLKSLDQSLWSTPWSDVRTTHRTCLCKGYVEGGRANAEWAWSPKCLLHVVSTLKQQSNIPCIQKQSSTYPQSKGKSWWRTDFIPVHCLRKRKIILMDCYCISCMP